MTFTLGDRRDGLVPDPAADPGARLGRSASTRPACSRRRRCRRGSSFSAAGSSAASSPRSFGTFGSEVTMIEMLDRADPAGGRRRGQGARQGSSARRGSRSSSASSAPQVEQSGSALTVHFGEGETVEADLMLVAVGRAPLVEGIGLEAAGIAFDTRKGIGADDAPPHVGAAHLRGRRLRRLLAARPHRLPRGRGRGRERLRPRRRRRRSAPCRARSTPTRRSPASG